MRKAAIEAAATDADSTMLAHSPCITHASTAPVAADDRLSYWDRHNADALVGLRTTSQSPDGLIARQTNTALPTMGLADIAGNAHAVERSARLVGMYPKEAVFACHLVKGTVLFIQGGEQFTLAAGDTIIYDTRRPYTFAFLSDMQQFLIDIAVAELNAYWGVRVDDLLLKIAPAGGVGLPSGSSCGAPCATTCRRRRSTAASPCPPVRIPYCGRWRSHACAARTPCPGRCCTSSLPRCTSPGTWATPISPRTTWPGRRGYRYAT